MTMTAAVQTASPVLAAAGLTKRFGDREVVSDLTLSVRPGRAFGLLGPNGAGKTTTVRLLNGLITPSSGSVSLFGEQLTASNADRIRSRIGVQTDTNLYETMTARENLRVWGELYGLRPRAVEERTAEILEVMDLTDRASSLVGTLSKGMRQKLAVGRAILHEPELLFLDEPTAGLDPETSEDLIEYLKRMIQTMNTTLVICTHQLHGLESLCDDVGFLVRGRMVATGEVDDLLRQRWPDFRFRIDVGGDAIRASAVITAAVGGALSGTVEIAADGASLTLTLSHADAIESVVATLVRHDISVRAVVPEIPTIQDLYFATVGSQKDAS